jgi:ABC-type uncharacterized transport system substrate-binding protein
VRRALNKRDRSPGLDTSFGMEDEGLSLRDAFRAGLRDLGYIEGENIRIEYRYAEARDDRLADLTAELIDLKVDVIVAAATSVYVAHRVTTTVPIVLASASDVVAMGIVDSLAHPGGNVTGSNFFLPELMAERLDLIKQIAPSTTPSAFSCAEIFSRRATCSTRWTRPPRLCAWSC